MEEVEVVLGQLLAGVRQTTGRWETAGTGRQALTETARGVVILARCAAGMFILSSQSKPSSFSHSMRLMPCAASAFSIHCARERERNGEVSRSAGTSSTEQMEGREDEQEDEQEEEQEEEQRAHIFEGCFRQPRLVGLGEGQRALGSVCDVGAERALRDGFGGYRLLFRNCEHFATWCTVGRQKSAQVRWGVSLGLLLLGAASGALAYRSAAAQDRPS